MNKIEDEVKHILKDTIVTFKKVHYFTRMNPKTKKNEVTLLYLEL
jgi:hypothetical protein